MDEDTNETKGKEGSHHRKDGYGIEEGGKGKKAEEEEEQE